MKSVKGWLVTGATLLMLTVPMAAHAYDWDGGWRHRDIARDRYELRGQWRDVHRDRWELNRDRRLGYWGAARAERADIRRDLMNVRRERRDLYYDYR